MSPPRRECSSRPRRVTGSLLAGLVVVMPAALAVADTTLTVGDAQVSAGEDAPLSFVIRRTGDVTDGVRVLVETVPGGPNPATPGEHYTPLPAGTEVTLAPGEASATVDVDVTGAARGDDRSLLLRLASAEAFSRDPRLVSAGLLFPVLGSYPSSMVVTDLDRDGNQDIVTGNDLSLDISVLLGDGAGGFSAPSTYPILDPGALLYAVSIAVGDVTGDGNPDVVAAGFNPALAYLFAGDGAGGLAEPTATALASADVATDIALADVNADGAADLVASIGSASEVTVLLGDGRGGFGAGEGFGTGAEPAALAIADLNGDGDLDVVTANSGGDASLLGGDGTGTFTAPRSIDLGPDAQPVAVAVGDVTGDGRADVVTANRFAPSPIASGTLSIAAGEAGGFAEPVQIPLGDGEGGPDEGDPPGLVAIGDVTLDGRADIVVSLAIGNAVVLLAGREEGGFADAVRVPVASGPIAVAIADVTGDDRADIVTANAIDNSVSILPGHPSGEVGFDVTDAGRYPHSIAAADLDGDGDADLATANAIGGDVSVLLSDGSGGLVAAGDFAVDPFPTWITSADLDGDAALDLVTANGSGTVSVLIGDGAGGFAPAIHFDAGELESPYAIVTGDVDEDGAIDIVTANGNIENDGMSVLLGDGKGGFGPPAVFEVGAALYNDPRSITLADVTGDGHLDAITANSLGSLSVLAGDGAGGFADAVGVAAGESPVGVAAADVTGDGRLDLVSLNHTAQSVSVLAGDGAGGFADRTEFSIFGGNGAACAFDITLPCPWPWGLAVADVDGDGDLDIVTANTDSDTVSLLRNDGSGDFSALEQFYTGAHPGSVVVADITGDGLADVITANRENDNVAVLSNRLGRVEVADDEGLGILGAGPVPPGEDDGDGDDGDGDDGSGGSDDGGCGCSAPGSSTAAGGLAPILVAVLVALRRRGRGSWRVSTST